MTAPGVYGAVMADYVARFGQPEPIARAMAAQRGRMPVSHSERQQIADDAHAIICARVGADPDTIREIALRVARMSLHPDENGTRTLLRNLGMQWPWDDAAREEAEDEAAWCAETDARSAREDI